MPGALRALTSGRGSMLHRPGRSLAWDTAAEAWRDAVRGPGPRRPYDGL